MSKPKTEGEISQAFEAEKAKHVDTAVAVPEYAGVDTRTPETNLATRSNIVTSGPGSTGYLGPDSE